MKIKINKKNIASLPLPSHGQVIYWDTELTGFGVKATPSGFRFVVQRRVDGGSPRTVIGRYGEITCDEARVKAQRLLAGMSDGINPNTLRKQKQIEQTTFREAYDDLKATVKWRPRTIQTNDNSIKRCFGDWEDKPLASISKTMVEERHHALSNKNGPRGKGEATANQAMRLLSRVWKHASIRLEDAAGKQLLPTNPVDRLTQLGSWNKVRRRQDILSSQDLPAWYEAVLSLESSTMRDYLLLLLFTGLRRTEALKLRWSNIDLKNKTLTVPSEDAKNHDPHCLPLPDFLMDLLNRRSKVRRIDNDYVFASDNGRNHIVEPKRAVETVCKRSGVKFTPHTMRRTFATTAERLDIPHYALKSLINHRDTSDVTSRYLIIEAERLRDPMQNITDALLTLINPEQSSSSLISRTLRE